VERERYEEERRENQEDEDVLTRSITNPSSFPTVSRV
jgi:hypothetical protein